MAPRRPGARLPGVRRRAPGRSRLGDPEGRGQPGRRRRFVMRAAVRPVVGPLRHRCSSRWRYADDRGFTGTDDIISDQDANPDHSAGSLEADPQPPAGMHGEKGPLFRFVRDQRVAFILVGGTNTVVGALWFIAFQLLLQPIAGYMAVL